MGVLDTCSIQKMGVPVSGMLHILQILGTWMLESQRLQWLRRQTAAVSFAGKPLCTAAVDWMALCLIHHISASGARQLKNL